MNTTLHEKGTWGKIPQPEGLPPGVLNYVVICDEAHVSYVLPIHHRFICQSIHDTS